MKLRAADGIEWKVFRRRLAWRPRLPRWLVEWFPEGWPDADSIIGLIVGAYICLLLLIASPALLWWALSWLVSLAVTPFVWVARTKLGRPTPVIAHRDDNPWAEWWASTDGKPAADHLVRTVAAELAQYGTPCSLTAPRQELVDLTTVRKTPIVERLTARWRSHRS